MLQKQASSPRYQPGGSGRVLAVDLLLWRSWEIIHDVRGTPATLLSHEVADWNETFSIKNEAYITVAIL